MINGRSNRNLPTGTDHLPDHSIPTSCVVPRTQIGDHLHTGGRRVPWTVCTPDELIDQTPLSILSDLS